MQQQLISVHLDLRKYTNNAERPPPTKPITVSINDSVITTIINI